MSLSDTTRPRVTTLHINALTERRRIIAEIASGEHLPTLEELYTGVGFMAGSWQADCRAWCDDLLLDREMSEHATTIRKLKKSCSRAALEALRTAIEHDQNDDVERLDVYLAAAGDTEAHGRVVLAMHRPGYGRPDFHRVCFAIAVARFADALVKPDTQMSAASVFIRSSAADLAMESAAGQMLDNQQVAPTPEEDLHERMAELETAIREDRAEIETREPEPTVGGIIVVPKLPVVTGFKTTIAKTWEEHAGKPLPLVKVGDIPAALKRVIAEMPHCRELAITLAMQLQPGGAFYLRPRLLVGDPGSGKSTFARVFTGAFSVPSEMHNLAGAADSSIGGTSAQFNSARESSFLQQIKREGIANPVAILDELEKASPSRHNGSALDAILPLLEKHTAKRYRDPALEVEVDLSGVTVIATANSLEGIPPALRDRFVIHQMPMPEWQHVGALSRSILNRIAEERSLDRRWFPDLEGDEIDVIKKAWTGGSIRRLEKAVRIIVDGRDQYLGRA